MKLYLVNDLTSRILWFWIIILLSWLLYMLNHFGFFCMLLLHVSGICLQLQVEVLTTSHVVETPISTSEHPQESKKCVFGRWDALGEVRWVMFLPLSYFDFLTQLIHSPRHIHVPQVSFTPQNAPLVLPMPVEVVTDSGESLSSLHPNYHSCTLLPSPRALYSLPQFNLHLPTHPTLFGGFLSSPALMVVGPPPPLLFDRFFGVFTASLLNTLIHPYTVL